MAPLVVIAAGGTGGHMFPAQALAEAMLARGWRVTLSTDARGARYAGGFPEAVRIEKVASATTARGGALARLWVPFRILAGIWAARTRMRADRPAAVVGFGGYPSIPALAAAVVLKLPRVLHEANGILGRVNQRFARHVDIVACGTWPTRLPAGASGVHLGNPVRAAVLARAAAGYSLPDAAPVTLLGIGGSQGARILSDMLPDAIARLPQALRARLRVQQQARPEDHDRVVAFYAAKGIEAEIAPFFEDIPRRMAEASLVVARAGASTLADLTVIGRPSILIPYAAASADHQTANAAPLAKAGAAVVIAESALDAAILSQHIETVLTRPGLAQGMARAALALGRPDAAEALADLVETLADRNRKRTA